MRDGEDLGALALTALLAYPAPAPEVDGEAVDPLKMYRCNQHNAPV